MNSERAIQRDGPCGHCGEPATTLSREYHGLYRTPDGETVPACSQDIMHDECAKVVIQAVESGTKPATLGEFR